MRCHNGVHARLLALVRDPLPENVSQHQLITHLVIVIVFLNQTVVQACLAVTVRNSHAHVRREGYRHVLVCSTLVVQSMAGPHGAIGLQFRDHFFCLVALRARESAICRVYPPEVIFAAILFGQLNQIIIHFHYLKTDPIEVVE